MGKKANLYDNALRGNYKGINTVGDLIDALKQFPKNAVLCDEKGYYINTCMKVPLDDRCRNWMVCTPDTVKKDLGVCGIKHDGKTVVSIYSRKDPDIDWLC